MKWVILYGFCSKLSYVFEQYKHFENRLRFDKVTESLKVETFFETQCIEGWVHYKLKQSSIMRLGYNVTDQMDRHTELLRHIACLQISK